jgi:hypothetical protein
VIGEAPNPVAPNMMYPAKITRATKINASREMFTPAPPNTIDHDHQDLKTSRYRVPAFC